MMTFIYSVFLIILVSVKAKGQHQPHIVYILADDLGWNDVGFHGSAQISTPNIDALAYSGLILNNHYVQPICTPSRAAFMTGKYPIHTGMQGYPPLLAAEPRALPAGKLLPGYLKDLGYKTNLIGKWHLGCSRLNETPTYRGFDYHLGYWESHISYYDHELKIDYMATGPKRTGYDMRRNTTVAWDLQGDYATDIFTREAVNVIDNHPRSEPLFLMLSHLAVHSGNTEKLLEAPQGSIMKHNHIVDSSRRSYAGMVSKLDDSVGEVVKALQRNNMLDNSIIVFASDNGAPTFEINPTWGSNYPLRGIKATLWEGGVRGVAAVWSPLITRQGVSKSLFHITDWMPTLIKAAGGDPAALEIDGIDQWEWLSKNASEPRNEVLINIYEQQHNEAVRKDQWKLINGRFVNGKFDGFYGESGKRNKKVINYNVQDVIESEAAKSISSVQDSVLSADLINHLREAATVVCLNRNAPITNCKPSSPDSFCLFDLNVDPCEMNDVSKENADVVKKLKDILSQYRATLVPQTNVNVCTKGAPEYHNYTWSNFMDVPRTVL